MGRPPAYIFIVRHGNRLDAADKQWHLSSPTPYDPPLTYSGWTQSRALGARIGEILRERILDDDRPSASPGAKPKGGRRFRVIIHSSPFLRCVQTSISLSAGLASDSSPMLSPQIGGCSPRTSQQSSPLASPTIGPPSRAAITIDTKQPAHPTPAASDSKNTVECAGIHKTVLRLDAFLGEWLSPGYFELITPPPGSVMMIASAKAELLRRENYNSYPHFQAPKPQSHHHHQQQHQAHNHGRLWSSSPRESPVIPSPVGEDLPPQNGLGNFHGMAASLPRSGSVGSRHLRYGRAMPMPPTECDTYDPPTPTFAVSSKAPIPAGYVAHARDACVQVDYQWDSMRAPYDWGDGGEFGEEWTSMHHRFRKGLQKMIEWYTTADKPYKMVTRLARSGTNGSQIQGEAEPEEPEDEDAEDVVILVSHGAGCNALIGAITHQPVLMDVGLTSLTMAVRKPGVATTPDSIGDDKQLGSTDRQDIDPVHETYDLKMFASTDHVRSNAPTPTASRHSSMANVMGGVRGRYSGSPSSSLGNALGSVEMGGSRSSSANASFNDYRRGSGHSSGNHATGGITVGSGVTSFSNPTGLGRKPSVGLWSPAARTAEEAFEDENEPDMVLNFGDDGKYTSTHEKTKVAVPTESADRQPVPALQPPTPGVEEAEKADTLSQLGRGSGGLWGQAQPVLASADLGHSRASSASKRRWTVNERT